MSAHRSLYQVVLQQLTETMVPSTVPQTSVVRLALLVTGLLAATSTVLAQVAAALDALHLTRATQSESIERRLRRTLSDPHLQASTCYTPVLTQVLDWPALLRGARRIVLAVDESSKADQVHLFRVSLPYWGGSLPLAWTVWEQNVALPQGAYWQAVDQVLAQVAALLPPELEVVIVADRAYGIPPFLDRCASYGWHWVLRLTTTGSHRFCSWQGQEHGLRAVVQWHLRQPGQRWRTRGQLFKDAGWRRVNLVGIWGLGAKEALVVITDLPPQWSVLRLYARRFWIEAGFRSDKRKGWQWEASQIQGQPHHERLLLGMAWASVIILCLGVADAQARIDAAQARPWRKRLRQVRHARTSIFTLGLRALRHWLFGTAWGEWRWCLPELDAPSWEQRWYR
ncbi:MAG TPA: transposase [Herpetosiphonaceae bacterium]